MNEENEGEKNEEKKEEENEVVTNMGTLLNKKLRTSLMKSRITLAQDDAFKTETRKYYRTYQIKFGDQIGDIHGEQIVFETYIVVDDKAKKKADEKK